MKVEFYGHVRQYKNIQKEIDANIQEVLLSGNYVQGPMLKRFEAELATYHGTKYAVGLANGTDAIELMKLKEVVDALEAAADAFETVANMVETIALKES